MDVLELPEHEQVKVCIQSTTKAGQVLWHVVCFSNSSK